MFAQNQSTFYTILLLNFKASIASSLSILSHNVVLVVFQDWPFTIVLLLEFESLPHLVDRDPYLCILLSNLQMLRNKVMVF